MRGDGRSGRDSLFLTPEHEGDVWVALFDGLYRIGQDGAFRRMPHVEQTIAMGYGKCVLIGSDIPEITAAHLQSGFDALESADVTLGPTEDGGYYLVGMKKPNKAVFEKQEYGTDSVYDNAVAAVKEAGLSFAPAMMCRDVDTPQDLMELKKRLCGKSSRTAQCIDKIL